MGAQRFNIAANLRQNRRISDPNSAFLDEIFEQKYFCQIEI